jgi:hypothetical protein
VDTEVSTKQDMITTSTSFNCYLITTSSAIVNSVDIEDIESVSFFITNASRCFNRIYYKCCFRVFSLSSSTINSVDKLAYTTKDYDTESGCYTTTFTYTISLAGTYMFTLRFVSTTKTPFEVN